jgi:hypothetical protein
LYGISQNSDTGDYILVYNWTSGNEKIDNFIKKEGGKMCNWILYNQFNEIKELGENVYSAIWKDGPLYKKDEQSSYTRDSNKKVILKCLYNSQISIDSLINEV